MSTLLKDIPRLAKKLEQETVRILCDLIRTPSFSTKEQAVVEVIRREMLAAGMDEVRVDGIGNIIGRIGNGSRVIAFDAHIDTVYEGDRSLWNTDPFDPVVRDGNVIGRGVADQKSGMASMLCAARIIRELDLAGDFTILFTGTVMEEDCDGLCWQYLIKEEGVTPELVVITEPTNLNIYRGHRGRMEMTVSVGGLSCHGSAPERGDNAAYKISRIALEIEKLNPQLAHDPFLGKGTVAVTDIHSESPSQCAVPDGAGLWLDRRLTVGETRDTALQEVREAAARAGYPDAVISVPEYSEKSYTGLCYPVEKYYPTWVTEPDSPYLRTAVSVYSGLFGREPKVDKWTFSTNGVSICGRHGIPCIGLGPGNEIHAHAPNEVCPVEHLSAAAAFYAAFAAGLNYRF